ncbi:hypothetical protein COO17_27950 [Bacillus wiedmannii]|uniref:Uncharacterized protein n=1 Tax=Bacillus wiedmannii TaxID=1890302 RepID=A0A2A7BJI3_9BACI|nr:hypothetical protein [Bacillus wiedmannii]PDY34173.1 hypothetical protein COO17_27950 [Bacillus wiedmannii]
MLKVKEYKKSQSINIEYDVYTPINIELGSWNISKEPTIYWRTGDFKKSLIEIGIGKYTGNIRSITLTLSENVHKMESLNLDMKNITLIKGVPSFHVEEYNDKTYIDENGELYVYIGIGTVLISFSKNDTVSIVQNDNVGFALDRNKMICGIIVSGMLEHEKNTLEDALK